MQPTSRRPSEIDAQKFLDGVARTYASLARMNPVFDQYRERRLWARTHSGFRYFECSHRAPKEARYEVLGQHLCLDTKKPDEALF